MGDAHSTDTPFRAAHPDELDEQQSALYERIVGGPRGASVFALRDDDGRLHGPFGPMMLSPELGDALQELGAAIRFRSGLDDRTREVVILVVAAARRSEFEWYAHVAVSRQLGIDDALLDAVRRGDDSTLDARLVHVLNVARAVAGRAGVDDTRPARAALGDREYFEVLVTAGYYVTLADVLAGFQIGLPENVLPVFGPA